MTKATGRDRLREPTANAEQSDFFGSEPIEIVGNIIDPIDVQWNAMREKTSPQQQPEDRG